MGGLTYHDFIKEAMVTGRSAELAAVARSLGGKLAAYVDSGRRREDVRGGLRLKEISGVPYAFEGDADPALLSVAFGGEEVVYQAEGLDPAKGYTLGISWWDVNDDHRIESIYAVGRDGLRRRTLVARRPLPAWANHSQPAEQLARTLPPECYSDGKVQIVVAKDSAKKGSNAVLSEIWLWEGGQGYDAQAPAGKSSALGGDVAIADSTASDPVGRRVAPGDSWFGDDRFYIDFSTPDPFTALEQYGLAVRAAQNARPNIYDFPTVCAWYVQDFNGGPRINNTAGLIGEMECVVKSGFLKYSPVALRLVPDTYGKNTEQGWWDEEHWQKYGHYTRPYETSEKWCGAIRRRGGLPFTYFQTGFVSADYAKAFPGHLLGNRKGSQATDPYGHLTGKGYDYTAADFRKHMREVWGKLGRAGMAGVMFDYPESGWRPEGGFEDNNATTTSAYREVFALCREGLGANAYIHERNIERWQPFVDATAGLVDSQRVWSDNSEFLPEMVHICGLRWYKNRVLYTYDMDAKSLLFRRLAQPPDAAVRRQSMLTMLYVTAGRVLLADSFRDLPPQILHELSRIFPIHSEARSAAAGLPRLPDPAGLRFCRRRRLASTHVVQPRFQEPGDHQRRPGRPTGLGGPGFERGTRILGVRFLARPAGGQAPRLGPDRAAAGPQRGKNARRARRRVGSPVPFDQPPHHAGLC